MKILTFYSDIGFTTFLSLQEFLSGIEMGVNIVCTLLLPGTSDWSFRLVAICKINSCLAVYAISVTLPLSSHGAR